ncbi:MAG: hypothetical protein M0Z66_05480 [Thermaerobacter sp.]|nr:hypothetical protein [Thermaerobacter sp.]
MLALLAFAILLYALSLHGFAGDLLMDIANGRWIIAHAYVPLHNMLTQARAGAPWANDEWLFGVYVAWLYAHLGVQGVLLGLAPVLAITALMMALMASRLRSPFDLAAIALFAFAMHITMSPRPQLFSYLFFAFDLWAVLEHRRGRRWPLWLAVSLVPLWANLHSSALLMPLLTLSVVVFGSPAARERRELLLAAAIGLVLFFAHPGGPAMGTGFLAQILTPGIVDHIIEWMSVSLFSPEGWPLLLVLPLGGWLGWRAARRGDLVLASWVILGIAMTGFAVRFVPYTVLCVLAVASLDPALTARFTHKNTRRVMAAALAVGTLLALASLWSRPAFVVREPITAITWLKSHRANDVLAFYSFGDALDFYGLRPFVDGRAELWTRQQWWPPYLDAQFGQVSPASFASKYDPSARYILWPALPSVVQDMKKNRSWRLVYRDTADEARTALFQIGPVDVWEKTTP